MHEESAGNTSKTKDFHQVRLSPNKRVSHILSIPENNFSRGLGDYMSVHLARIDSCCIRDSGLYMGTTKVQLGPLTQSTWCPEKQQVAQNSTVSYMWVDRLIYNLKGTTKNW